MKHVDFKPKLKIRVPESKKEQNTQISITIKKKSKRVERKRKPSCLDCIDGKLIKSDEGFRGKTDVHCYTWNLIVHPRQARICPCFCPRGGKDGRKRSRSV
ncbi:MAG: hypothetical protein NDP13_06590 [Crenarchaeota archaeon]|nr:hypothetical protein [Thermoproteota archaeon]